MIFIAIIIILFVSFGMSVLSLKGEMKKLTQIKKAEEELARGKVLFQASSSLDASGE